ncbi:MAG: 5-oxoprolinase subunit PxpA [Vicinamibacterales bacterium]
MNVDAGELPGPEGLALDRRLFLYASSTSIACGGHAGDAVRMGETARAALDAGVAVGAHPGYADREGFGRRELGLTPAETADLVRTQCAALADALPPAGGALQHVKLHGALYHRAASDRAVAAAVADAVIALDPRLIVVGMPRSYLALACAERGLTYAREAFADRGYAPDGRLLPRSEPGGVITGEAIPARAVQMVRDGVLAPNGTPVPVGFDTLCLHSDTPGAGDGAAGVRLALDAAGISVAPLATVLRR